MSESMAQCPFNPAHVVSGRRLQVHIERCKKTAPNAHLFDTCKFNYTHLFRKGSAKEHYDNCKSKIDFLDDDLGGGGSYGYVPARLINNTSNTVSMEESWEDVEAPEFDPEERKASARHMVLPEGLSKAKRKEHREAELQRIRDLQITSGGKEKEIKKPAPKVQLPTVEEVECRKPNMIYTSSRIAAKFIQPNVQEAIPQRQPDRPASSTSFVTANSSLSINNIGRGRGLLNLGNQYEGRLIQGGNFYCPSEDDFPKLG